METWVRNFYLAHHGIKGQKWGVRRYQNKDGSLTATGRKRYSKEYKNLVNERDSLVGMADKYSKEDAERAKSNRQRYDSLKKNGYEKAFKDKKYLNEWGIDENALTSDESFSQLYGQSKEDFFNYSLKQLESYSKGYEESAKAWLKTRDDLMSLDVNELSSEEFKNKLNKIWNG